ncbi:protoporphyrinogen/coproporphyrinogen oxidase [Celerinatantimonas sp. YJH-8]|uniref:protoporphyrinogen/coproporphyrinogen oxidase n=1 Tax=Celerinatantimonas sp. YJH-8 TaxID=3228714 RepID=UPI0038BF5F8A
MKIAVIGSGISGLAIGRILTNRGDDVTIYEKKSVAGGIARTKTVDGISYHVTGGHCFNSKHQDVLDFVFKKVLNREQWHKVERKSRINFKGHLVSYPIEFAMKEIAKFDLEMATSMVNDYFNTGYEDRKNLASWFKSKFGVKLAEEYFIPYNEKIWNQKADSMMPDWVEDKLPLPDKNAFTKALLKSNRDTMPHSSFYYPNSNNQNTFIDSLSKGLNIVFDTPVHSAVYTGNKWILNNEIEFDVVISTMPLNILPYLFSNVPDDVRLAATKLKYNKVSTMLWKTSGNTDTWTYHPDKDTLFHRHIHIGNFFDPKNNYSITEAVGEHSFQKMKNEGEKFEYLIEPLDYYVSDHAYVVFDHNYHLSRKTVMNYIDEKINFYTLGRFGEWEYYNMDICIKKALDLYSQINNKI